MNLEVTSVSKKEQKLWHAAAAVFVITQEDIRRSGAKNIPDLLRMVPGVDVAQLDANIWVISIRGFADRFSDKALVLALVGCVRIPIRPQELDEVLQEYLARRKKAGSTKEIVFSKK